jgi:isoquinoline 1-oxidoreductase subunit beta
MTTHQMNNLTLTTSMGRRRFLKASVAASGGLMLNFSWLSSVAANPSADAAKDKVVLNAYIHIDPHGAITAMVPNPEFGQNLMTSMPMILAEELDAEWANIICKQAPFSPNDYQRQFTGGSQSIRQAWQSLRMAGAGARHLLRQAAAAKWQVPVNQVTTDKGVLSHQASQRHATYGEMAADAALMPLPDNISLKNADDFSIVGQSRKNLEGHNIVTGKPMFGLDYQMDGMLIAMIEHPPAFGQTLDNVDLSNIKKMPGIVDAFVFDVLESDYTKTYFDVVAFPRLIAIVGERTWDVMKAKKALSATWKTLADSSETIDRFGTPLKLNIPGGLESTAEHRKKMDALLDTKLELLRKDGDPEKAFKQATKVIESIYYAPYLAHNTMEPMNFFANVTADEVHVAGPLQAPSMIEGTVAARLKVAKEKVRIEMTRMGGGFGRRAYSHYLVEAAVISATVKKPIKLIYSRPDDMTMGIYRPSYQIRLRAALDSNNQMTAYQVSGVGVPEHSVHADRFPAGAVDNYLAEGQAVDSNITTGAFRAPRSNFMASAEQAFLDEVAEAAGQDPIAFRLALFAKARSNPVGDKMDYDPIRYAGVLELVRDKSGWQTMPTEVKKGVSAYYCHNSYAAHVITVVNKDNKPKVDEVFSAVDCGIVVNPDSAVNMVEGAVIDGIGNAMYGEMTFTDGKPDKNNFDRYRMIRINEIPKAIQVNFVDNKIDPTGLGEPPFAPVFAALANALYQATGKRLYEQPYAKHLGI